jgi:hypothetical protein
MATTLQLQQSLNMVSLKPMGYTPLVEDGLLGAKTCGALKQFMPASVPSECSAKGFTAPTKAGSGTTVSVAKATTVAPAPIQTTQMSLLSSTKWIIGSSVALALGLVGFAVAKKKGWIK